MSPTVGCLSPVPTSTIEWARDSRRENIHSNPVFFGSVDLWRMLYTGETMTMIKKTAHAKHAKKRKTAETVVVVSGGFDPLHIGHVRMFREAKALGNRLVVILNNDNWLCAKKGFVFMPEGERKEIIEALSDVDEVVVTKHTENDPDRSVTEALKEIRPQIFANGGDRKTGEDIPEEHLCRERGIAMVFNVGRGGKVSSSSALARAAARALRRNSGRAGAKTTGVAQRCFPKLTPKKS